MATVRTLGGPVMKVLSTLLIGAWVVFGAWGLALFISGEEFGTLDKLILLAWLAHIGILGLRWRRRTPQQRLRATPCGGERRRVSPSRAFGVILAAGFALVLLSCVLMALGTLV
ncbi:MAG: hypothetical protein M3P51_02985 [Chloroflexota bacterium]|nr:hypothetical protein [Chloroflexota bacterium]